MDKLNILKIIIDVLWFFVASINAGLHFLFNKMTFGIIWFCLAIAWILIFIADIKIFKNE